MARSFARSIMGYLPLLEKHHAAVLSLVAKATPSHRFLDPTAGDGEFAEAAGEAWGMTVYTNELDHERADACIELFGANALQGDVERLTASTGAFSLLWSNPPYDIDKTENDGDSKRVEYRMLRQEWKWLQDNGIAMWCVYLHHITPAAATFLAKNSRSVDIWALPGKHLDTYDQIVVVAIKGHSSDEEALFNSIMAQKASPRMLVVQDTPLYKLPAPPVISRFVFAPNVVDEATGLRYVTDEGAWQNPRFQTLLLPETEEYRRIESITPPRPGHTTIVLAAGMTDGAIIDSAEHGQVALRGKTERIETTARVETEPGRDPEHTITRTTKRLAPKSTLTLLTKTGTVIHLNDDTSMIDFIVDHKQALTHYIEQRFEPMYKFDLNGLRPFLDPIRLNGKYELYTAQKHVVAALTRGFEKRDGILLVGAMGTGKTILGSSAAIAISTGAAKAMRKNFRDDQVTLIVCPPHLVNKWEREAQSVSPRTYIAKLKRHEDVKAFMDKAAALGPGIAKIGIIKREMTKLGSGFKAAVVWKPWNQTRWKASEPTAPGYSDDQRLIKRKRAHCPTCGEPIIERHSGETPIYASQRYLDNGKRTCDNCHSPLWQETRNSSSAPKPGEKYPRGNPRYRLDKYLQRFPDRVALLIWDEVHEAKNGDTGNGEAFGRMCQLSSKTLAMTGTPFNGKASSMFNLEHHLNPRACLNYPWGGAPRFTKKDRISNLHDATGHYCAQFEQTALPYNSEQRGESEADWVDDMGVREGGEDEVPQYDSETGAYTGTSTYIRPYVEAPGISPLLVAETLDHTVFFSLNDMSTALPDYVEIAHPVEMDSDIAIDYDDHLKDLKDYLLEMRLAGDSTFRGAYFHWSIDWPNSSFLPYEVIHNQRHPITREITPYTVKKIASTGADRILTKEQDLIDIVREELEQDRPCIVYCRQTDKRDIQGRLQHQLEHALPLAKVFILQAKVDPDRREAVIDKAVTQGFNIIISNPELVKTGLDLVFAGTLIFFEPIYNLSTMMQASGRNYRLNQKRHKLCKVIYMYYVGTMEEKAVQLMSRKQRAAKILLGETGLTGLEALTEGDGGFEEALLRNLTGTVETVDPSTLFQHRDEAAIIDAEDTAYWNVALADLPVPPQDSLIAAAQQLGSTVITLPIGTPTTTDRITELTATLSLGEYLDAELLCGDPRRKSALIGKITNTILSGCTDGETTLVGIQHPDYVKYPSRQNQLHKAIMKLLRSFVSRKEEPAIATQAIQLAHQASALAPANDIFQAMSITVAHEAAARMTATPVLIHSAPASAPLPPSNSAVRETIAAALQPCLPPDATEAQRIDFETHCDALRDYHTSFVAETPIFWEGGDKDNYIRGIRLYLIRNHLADVNQAAAITSKLLPALQNAAVADAKTRLKKHAATPAKPKAKPHATLDSPLSASAQRFHSRLGNAHTDSAPQALEQLSLMF